MTRHFFQPTHYYNTLGSHEPVLRVADGDVIETTTVDARGQDSSGARITPPGNPMTGPFYVEGAEPGDTLVVRLDRITPNRSMGWSGALVAPNVIDPWDLRDLPAEQLAEWHVDAAHGTATLLRPTTK